MAWQVEKETGDIVITFPGDGIAPAPEKGLANIQAADISGIPGEVMTSFGRIRQSQWATITNQLNARGATTVTALAANGVFGLHAGTWIHITSSSITNLSNGNYYYVLNCDSNGIAQLSNNYNGVALSSLGVTGTATFDPVVLGSPIDKATEIFNQNGTTQYRYYILDANLLVWVYDTTTVNTTLGLTWFLPDINPLTGLTNIAILNGWLLGFTQIHIYGKSTVNLGGTTSTSTTWVTMKQGGRDAFMMDGASATPNPHKALTGHQGRCYYCDGTYVGSIFPDITADPSGAATVNVQSFCSYTAATTAGTITNVYTGTIPSSGVLSGETGYFRIPAVFFTDQAGTQPTNLTAGTVYYIDFNPNTNAFGVFSAATGGSAINIQSGAVGNQYFNTFFPTSSDATGASKTVVFSPQRLNLPAFETALCLTEVGNNVIVGCTGNVLYPWNQVDPTPSGLINLPENNTTSLITVNQMAYAFVGNRGNIYITDSSVASLVLKVPDYCAGIAGTPTSYIQPVFVWGDSMYLRGRVYFSILDQTSTKTGNCGGIWSFVPTQNLYIGQDTGIALRLENQNSYGTYNGVAAILIPNQTQATISPQYWSAWYSSISGPTYGIDATNTFPTTTANIECDLIPTGTLLGGQRQTFANIEYKLSAPLVAGESVVINFRQEGTAAFASAGTMQTESTTDLAGYVGPVAFEKTQWLQLQAQLIPNGTSTFSGNRLYQIRIRNHEK